ncbi:gamma-secretase subunit pen-2 [Anaeramoeba ignava]|uniref:Gamma-secretase subunit pen-2 n=1 Tax=Anaeramoeba ignava TaxID=1746090 RepID=A0A9Q0RIF8_ANAIG|nr:gamma-secretase subunit pen-2 [Anaeramoeba ignava]
MDPSTPLTEEQKIKVAKKMYIAGFFFLPWLWFCLAIYFRKEKNEILQKYVKKAYFGFFVFTFFLLTWMAVFLSQRDRWGVKGDNLSVNIPYGDSNYDS